MVLFRAYQSLLHGPTRPPLGWEGSGAGTFLIFQTGLGGNEGKVPFCLMDFETFLDDPLLFSKALPFSSLEKVSAPHAWFAPRLLS